MLFVGMVSWFDLYALSQYLLIYDLSCAIILHINKLDLDLDEDERKEERI